MPYGWLGMEMSYRWLGMGTVSLVRDGKSAIVGWEAHDCAARTLSERWEGMGLYRWLGMGGVIVGWDGTVSFVGDGGAPSFGGDGVFGERLHRVLGSFWGKSAIAFLGMEKIDRALPKPKKPGFSDNLCLYTDILSKNPVSEPPSGQLNMP